MTFNSASGRRIAIRRAIAFCALAALAVGTAFGPGGAAQADTTITNSTTTPLLTSTGGNITVNSGGSITVAASQTAVTVDSDNSLTNNGAINALLAGGTGIDVTADTTGGIVIGGSINTGTAQVVNTNNSIATAAVIGGPAIEVSKNVGGGIKNTGTISTVGANTVLIQATTTDILVGNVGASPLDYGLYNTGAIGSNGGTSGLSATTIQIEGTAVLTASLDGGLFNSGSITSAAVDNSATTIHIGQGGIVDTIANTGTISAATSANAIPSGPAQVGGTATAILVDAGGTLNSLTNTGGTITATASFGSTNAAAVRDLSGTLTSVTNTGTIQALAGTTALPGVATALDLGAATTATTVTNSGTIIGDIDLGSGGNTITQTAGSITGAISLGAGTNAINQSGGTITGNIVSTGTDTITLSGTAVMVATSDVPGGTLGLDVQSGAKFQAASGGVFNATTANFAAGSTLTATFDPTAPGSSGLLKTSGTTTFDTTTPATAPTVDVVFTSYLATPQTITIAEASGFVYTGGGSVSDLQIGAVGFGYNAALADSGTAITLDVSRKSATQLGYTGNLAAIYNAAPTALMADTAFGAAVGNLTSAAALKSAYNQLLPDLSGAREETAIRVQDISAGLISDRLNLLRTADQGVGDGGGDYAGYKHKDAGFWAQEAVSSEKGKGGTASPDYSGTMYVFSGGFDQRDGDGDVWGASVSYAALTFNTPVSPSDDLSKTLLAQVYHSMNRGPLFWDMVGGLGWNSYDGHRSVVVGSITRQADATWSGYQGGLSSQVGYAANLGSIAIRPSAGLSYTVLQQQAYKEEGGQGIDLAIDSNTFQSLRANAEIRISGILFAEPQIVPFLRGGISHEILDARPKADGHFVAGGSSFSLEGDPLNKDTPYVGLGLSAVGGFSRLSVEYTGMFGDRVTSHQAAATISMAF